MSTRGCWTKYAFSFETTRPAFTGEQLTFQVQLVGARSWAFGFEGAHASKVRVRPAALPPTGLEFGVTITEPAAGSSVAEFGSPIEAALDGKTGTWTAPLGALRPGTHTVFARAVRDRTTSQVASNEFTVAPEAQVQWQVVDRNRTPAADGWRRAEGVADWRFAFDTADHGSGAKTILTRLVVGDLEVARQSVRARFS
ncbi:hypothetical protein [Saccharothrix sp. NRRL B-16314]|uniref:hypothetical protein n=1 Tax=Saccharothrix sp. NRRL B-16314 TaxID=1463825 RepID=UPI00052616BF|nr:hypothetical protein [Saccharothrix sp. NRRL B-16314]